MKIKWILLAIIFSINLGFAQDTEIFEVKIEAVAIPNMPGIHSYSWAINSSGQWLIVGGRIDGLHRRQPWASFWEEDNNKHAFVIDPQTEQVWSAPLSVLPASMFEQLQSTNQEFFQRENTLYVFGGYGYSASVGDHITYSNMTATNVDEVTDAIINGNSITPYFRQITDSRLAVTGGQLEYLDAVFYLAGGQYFEGRYNPMGPNMGPGFIQEYVEEVRKFKIVDDGNSMTITDYVSDLDTENLHRRDYSMAAQIFPNGEKGFTMFSGVFQKTEDLPFLNTVDVTLSGHTVNNDFNQYLSQYHNAHVPIFDENGNAMHTLFFGGMSQFTLNANGNLVEDQNVPFVKTISRVTRYEDGNMEEVKLNIEMPTLVGAGAEFIPLPDAPFDENGILLLNEISQQETHVGYIFGGIESSQDNIFFINNGNESSASNVIFKVFIEKSTTGVEEIVLTPEQIFNLKLFPNPTKNHLTIKYNNPKSDKIKIELIGINGQLLKIIFEGDVESGEQKVQTNLPDLKAGTYFISIENSVYKTSESINIR